MHICRSRVAVRLDLSQGMDNIQFPFRLSGRGREALKLRVILLEEEALGPRMVKVTKARPDGEPCEITTGVPTMLATLTSASSEIDFVRGGGAHPILARYGRPHPVEHPSGPIPAADHTAALPQRAGSPCSRHDRVQLDVGEHADSAGGRPFRRVRLRRLKTTLGSALLAAILALSLAPTSAADATATLRSQVDAARGGCPALQSDPVLNDVAHRANTETQSYIEHTARFEPFEDPMPVLRDLGYSAGKAKLIPGYGDIEAKAIRGVVVHGWEAIPDCTYTRYGVHVLDNSEGTRGKYTLAALVLAGD